VHVLFAARFVLQKAPDLLPAILQAAHSRTSMRDVRVTIAGDGPLADELKRGLDGVAPGWSIAVVPPMERLNERLADFDVVLMPSRFEGLGLLAVETLIAGVPLIATDALMLTGVLPTNYPFKARVDDAAELGRLLGEVVDDPSQARAVAAALRGELVARYSPTAMAEAYRERYVSLAGATS
jgi:glycosyltransferase involved in cell wall biosynthesis